MLPGAGICASLLFSLLCLVSNSYGESNNCYYIANKTDSVQWTCGSGADESGSPPDGCIFDLFESPSNHSHRANVKLLRIYDNECEPFVHHENISKMFPNIQELEYSFTAMHFLRFDSKWLQKLNVSHNHIKVFDYGVGDFKHVYEIDVSHNAIETIHDSKNLKTSIHLKYLNLSHNSVNWISKDTFVPHNRLKILDLSQNRIEVLQSDTFRNNTKLSVLRLEGNPLKRFDCHLLWP